MQQRNACALCGLLNVREGTERGVWLNGAAKCYDNAFRAHE